jgi:hypothetical protein
MLSKPRFAIALPETSGTYAKGDVHHQVANHHVTPELRPLYVIRIDLERMVVHRQRKTARRPIR